ncbi:MAG: SDR family oxidoreductase [Chloroflexi bacterium]|nr:SDR family oxidoreductase [Chloroflexota bacterium]
MHGKTVLITGGTNGIGLETARALAKMGAHVVIVGRSPQKTEAVVADLRESTGSAAVDGLLADLSLMREVNSLADTFLARYDRLDVLVNNAGAIFYSREVTDEGLELTFALNHMSYYLLTRRLLPLILASAPSRIVNVSSGAHFSARGVDFDDLQKSRGYIGFTRYSESKLMNILFSNALARRLEGTGVTVNALHPGMVATGFGRNNSGIVAKAAGAVFSAFGKSPEDGALTSIYAATAPELAHTTGAYFDNERVTEASRAARDVEAQEHLWAISAEIAGLPAEVAVRG